VHPHTRLAAFYFAYFGYLGAFTPYFSLYLKELGLAAAQIAIVVALPQLVKVFAPTLLAWLADTRGARRPFIIATTTLTAASLALLHLAEGFWGVCAVVLLMGLASSGTLPMVEATTMSLLAGRSERYGPIRLWGSVGFILTVMGTGALLDVLPIGAFLGVVVVLSSAAALAACGVPESAAPARAAPVADARWMRPEVLAFFGACFAMTVAHGTLYGFYSIYLVQAGYSKTVVGLLWTLGVLAEILLFWKLPRLYARASLSAILCAACLCAALRFVAIGWGVGSLVVLVLAQLLHGATFGAYHAASVAAVHKLFPGERQVRGQALYSSLSYGLGGATGLLLAGWCWEAIGPALSFGVSAGFGLLGAALVAWRVRV
jgi:PPP family 3-phenylpropionic acid transporter